MPIGCVSSCEAICQFKYSCQSNPRQTTVIWPIHALSMPSPLSIAILTVLTAIRLPAAASPFCWRSDCVILVCKIPALPALGTGYCTWLLSLCDSSLSIPHLQQEINYTSTIRPATTRQQSVPRGVHVPSRGAAVTALAPGAAAGPRTLLRLATPHVPLLLWGTL